MLLRRWVLRKRKEKERRRILSKKRMEIEKLLMIPYLREANCIDAWNDEFKITIES
jgi:hypothetical protein